MKKIIVFTILSMILVFGACGNVSDSSVQNIDVDQIQYEYNDIINNIIDKCDSEFNRGSILDFFDKGTNDMVLTFTPDNSNIYAGIYTWNKDHVEKEELLVMNMAGSAKCEIYPGYYGEGKDVPVYYIVNTNFDGDRIFGNILAYSVSEGVITSVYSDEFYNQDEWKTISGNADITLGECACEFNSTGAGIPIANLRVS